MELDLAQFERPGSDARAQRVGIVRGRFIGGQHDACDHLTTPGRHSGERDVHLQRLMCRERGQRELTCRREPGAVERHARLTLVPCGQAMVRDAQRERSLGTHAGLLGFERERMRDERGIPPTHVRGPGCGVALAERGAIVGIAGVLGDARERAPRRDIGRGRTTVVLVEREVAPTEHLARAIRPHEPHGIGSVLQVEIDEAIRRRCDERTADHEACMRRERIAGATGPAQRPSSGRGAVARLESQPLERRGYVGGVRDLDVLVPDIITDGVVVHLVQARPRHGCTGHGEQQQCGERGHGRSSRGRDANGRDRSTVTRTVSSTG